jgi:hypothetical protein
MIGGKQTKQLRRARDGQRMSAARAVAICSNPTAVATPADKSSQYDFWPWCLTEAKPAASTLEAI